MPGKAITLFLVGGTSTNGVTTVEIMGWSGKLLVCFRTQLKELIQRQEIAQTGVYILIGDDPQNPLVRRVYIGQGDSVVQRLLRHENDANKAYWEQTIVITSKDKSLTAAHVRYMESCLVERVDRSQFTLDNIVNPNRPNLPEPDTAYMESFLGEVELLLPVLGLTLIQPIPVRQVARRTLSGSTIVSSQSDGGSPIFQLAVDGQFAQAQQVNGQFIILQGSAARKDHRPSLPDSMKRRRDQLKVSGKVTEDQPNDCWIFEEDVAYTSPSTAASIVLGTPTNGRISWQVQGTGQTYHQWQTAQVQSAATTALLGTSDDQSDGDDDAN